MKKHKRKVQSLQHRTSAIWHLSLLELLTNHVANRLAHVALVSLQSLARKANKMASFELLSDQSLRLDGRKAGELRRLRCRMGVFSQADGSAYLEMGNTKVSSSLLEN